jgi:hypothetical protein
MKKIIVMQKIVCLASILLYKEPSGAPARTSECFTENPPPVRRILKG